MANHMYMLYRVCILYVSVALNFQQLNTNYISLSISFYLFIIIIIIIFFILIFFFFFFGGGGCRTMHGIY